MIPAYSILLTHFGPVPNVSERVYIVSDHIRRNVPEKGRILQGHSYYSYLSGVDDVTTHGWILKKELFDLSDLEYIILETKPAYIILTYDRQFPDGAVEYLNSTYEFIDLGYDGLPYLYKTGYNVSIAKPRLMHEIFSRKLLD